MNAQNIRPENQTNPYFGNIPEQAPTKAYLQQMELPV
tara:strand:- start:555 stop:665 length:111 start_codon:yes stop_codon:yes gene_type:complete